MAQIGQSNRPSQSYFSQYDKSISSVPQVFSNQYQGSQTMNNSITPISHQSSFEPTYNQNNNYTNSLKSYNKPFAPPSKSPSYSDALPLRQLPNTTGPLNSFEVSNKAATKKYAFEVPSSDAGNIFNVDKYFENFKDPFADIDLANHRSPGNQNINNNMTIPKTTQSNSVPAGYGQSIGLGQQQTAPLFQQQQQQPQQFQSRLVYEQRYLPQEQQQQQQQQYQQQQYPQNDQLDDYKGTNPPRHERAHSYLDYEQTQPQPGNISTSAGGMIQPRPIAVLPQSQQFNYSQEYPRNRSQSPKYDITLPPFVTADNNKQKDQQQLQSQTASFQAAPRSGGFYKANIINEEHSLNSSDQQQNQTKIDENLKMKYEAWKKAKSSQNSYNPQNNSSNAAADLQFQKQVEQYLIDQSNRTPNILQQLEQRNNITKYPISKESLIASNPNNSNNPNAPLNPYRSQAVQTYEKSRNTMQSQAFLNKLSRELDAGQVYFLKFLVEQLTIDYELDKARENILKSTEFAAQTLFTLFDRKKKGFIDFNSFIEALETLSIPYIKHYIQKLFNRLLQNDSKTLRYCDFVEIFEQAGKPTQITQIFSFVGPKNGVAKQQKKTFNIINEQSLSLGEDAHKHLNSIFQHLLSIEKSIQSFRDLQGDEENLLQIFKSVDKSKKGYLTISDLCDFLNDHGGDYSNEELVGVFRRFNCITHSGRINFHEFLVALQREAAPVEKIALPEPTKATNNLKQNYKQELQNGGNSYQQSQQQSQRGQQEQHKILKEANFSGFKKIGFKGKQKQ